MISAAAEKTLCEACLAACPGLCTTVLFDRGVRPKLSSTAKEEEEDLAVERRGRGGGGGGGKKTSRKKQKKTK